MSLPCIFEQGLETKKYVLLFAYNGTGKTRLSTSFKDIGKQGDARDTLYFNAFTEDLFTWDNDLEGDSDRNLKINSQSRFFSGLEELEMDNRVRPLLQRYADFDFRIDTGERVVRFSRSVGAEIVDNIKVSRGEENIFIWRFFLAIVQLALDGAEAYQWVKYIYIDDPISSLDEHNAIAVANHLAQLLKKQDSQLRTVISSHHTLFFNVLCNELSNARKYFLSCAKEGGGYLVRETGDTPFFHHVAALAELHRAAESGTLYTYHFNMLRPVLEKAASFHGFNGFSACIKQDDDDQDGVLHTRIINILNHGNYSLYEPTEMIEENKVYFRKILQDFMDRFPFNPELFAEEVEQIGA
ncbi:MAG TPA: hypothetical protein VK638_01670 [Edaphobacter sp.]|nr:hypothetical protein [Edaphobacter sp.]